MIYVITHKDFDDSFLDEHYGILHVGDSETKNKYLRDDTGDNISFKNPYYSEMTGLYWIWKNSNLDDDSITGLVHYRRFFTNTIGDLLYTYFDVKPNILKFETIENSLKHYDAIVPKKEKIIRTVKEFYAEKHVVEDLDTIRDVIGELTPEYLKAFDAVMSMHSFYYASMILCRMGLLERYCEWAFPVMFEIEKRTHFSKYDSVYQQRLLGFTGERLLHIWIVHNNVRVKEYPIFNTESKRLTIIDKNISRMKKIICKLCLKKGC